jgi:hypothetical protein
LVQARKKLFVNHFTNIVNQINILVNKAKMTEIQPKFCCFFATPSVMKFKKKGGRFLLIIKEGAVFLLKKVTSHLDKPFYIEGFL